MNTITLGACFQHELHTGPHLLPDYETDVSFIHHSFRRSALSNTLLQVNIMIVTVME